MAETSNVKYCDELANRIIKETDNEYMKIVYKQAEYIFRSAIDEYYASYSPYVYERTGNLYNAYEVNFNKETLEVSITLDSSFLKDWYRNGEKYNDYIAGLAFEEGYHGGAKKGKKHPNEGVPYWRTPHPFYTQWGTSAKKTEPIESIIQKKINQWNKKNSQYIYDKILNETATRIFKKEGII